MARGVTGQSKWAGSRALWEKICIAAFILALVSVSDALISTAMKPANRLDLVLGTAIPLTGQVYGKAETPQDLRITTGTPGLEFGLEKDLFKGFWLGGQMWRGKLSAASTLQPGSYAMTVDYKDLSEIKPEKLEQVRALCAYTVQVHASAQAMRQAAFSLITRYTGLRPWPLALGFFGVIALAGGSVFFLSGKIEEEMIQQGMAEIYRIKPSESGVEIFFGLGKRHGLEPGEVLNLLSGKGEKVGEITAHDIGLENSSALVNLPGIMPGGIVQRSMGLGMG